jgi:hypothetical protein
METPKLQNADVESVAKSINQTLTEAEIKECLERYDGAEEQDPTATWNLIMEEVIYQVVGER